MRPGNTELRGSVTDPSGAVIANANVVLVAPNGAAVAAQTDRAGSFHLAVAPGKYVLTVAAPGFSTFTQTGLSVHRGMPALTIKLSLGTQKQQVTVQASPVQLSVNSQDTVGAVILKGKALKALPDDPDELASDLEALAGPSVGSSGAEIYIDGFTGGDLPPKSSIREIRVNQDPFSAEYDRLGYGRIEILTKPGSDQFHGRVFVDGNSSFLNARSPFIFGDIPSYHRYFMDGNIGGPLSKKASFFFNFAHRNIDELAVVNTDVLGSNFQPQLYTATLPNPRTWTSVAPRIDYQLSQNNTLTLRYQFQDIGQQNNGVGTQALQSLAYNTQSWHNMLQVSDTQIVSPSFTNETRFQLLHFHNVQDPSNFAPEINVIGAFSSGGNSVGSVDRGESHYEFQNYSSWAAGKHFVRFGEMVRDINRTDISTGGFNGAFTFNSLNDYAQTEQALAAGQTMAQIQAAGYGPSQFSITMGIPQAHVNRVDAALFAEDNWRVASNLNLYYGMRFETQNAISDHADWAPRLGFAWGVGHGRPKTVVRGGFGVFYDRFDDDQMMEAERFNGVNQVRYLVANPTFYPNAPGSFSPSAASLPTVYVLSPNLHAPYMVETALAVERQISKNITGSVTYLNSRGNDQFLTNDINAPLPGTYDPTQPTSGVRPLGAAAGNVYQFQSTGIFRQNQLIANFHINAGRALTLFGFYTLNFAKSDTNGIGTVALNPYNLMADYGRAAFDVRHRLFVAGNVNLPYGFSVFPFVVINSGAPYSITTGQDLFGTGVFNGLPALATSSTPPQDVRVTPFGTFNIAPSPSDALIAPNIATGPAQVSVNMRLSRSFYFGGESKGPHGGPGWHPRGGGLGGRGLSSAGGGPPWMQHGGENHKYSLTASIQARNIFNTVNLAPPVGNLNSPLFGQSLSLAGGWFSAPSANREVDLQLAFSF